jgi:hypothetical protein
MVSYHQAVDAVQDFGDLRVVLLPGQPGPPRTTWIVIDYAYEKFYALLPGTPRDSRVMSIASDAARPS